MAWNDQTGDWQGLEPVTPNYHAIIDLVKNHSASPYVLDIGCGTGVLGRCLSCCVYTGIEPSSIAAAAAREYGVIYNKTAEDFEPRAMKWDCIIFNEVLYYCHDPIGLLCKYQKYLKPGGILIVSIYQKGSTPTLKQRWLHWLDRRRPMTNLHCSKMVNKLFEDQANKVTVAELGTDVRWKLWTVATDDPGVRC
jgi:SAM-dependent methyltransferase